MHYALTKLMAYGPIKTPEIFIFSESVQIDIKALRLIIKVLKSSLIIHINAKIMKKTLQSIFLFVGIDVSKLTLDVTEMNTRSKTKKYTQVENSTTGLAQLEIWFKEAHDFQYANTIFCFEHTGMYTRVLLDYLMSKGANVWMESSLHIKKSLGLNRGKNDKIDSYRIAEYAYRFSDKACFVENNSPEVVLLKDLLSARTRLKKSLQQILVTIKELTKVDEQQGKEIEILNLHAIKGLKASIQQIEEKIHQVIESNNQIKEVYELITSIPGVGFILAAKLLVYTKVFTSFSNVRQLACYCGVAPFEYRSGTSVKGKTGVSKFANMDLKATLHLASISAIQHNVELKKYYKRKVEEGKSKMVVINAVRNKLLARVVAVVNRKTPYVSLIN